jgi:ABC-type proline/glycine betaine transport system permease subunit
MLDYIPDYMKAARYWQTRYERHARIAPMAVLGAFVLGIVAGVMLAATVAP